MAATEVSTRSSGQRFSTMTWIIFVVACVHAVGLGWGMPGSDGWDNDGVAPRHFLPGLAATFTTGRFYTYPPVHLALLAVVTAPIALVAAVRAPSSALGDVVGEIVKVPYMTATAYVARSISVAMSIGVVLFLARIAEEIRAAELGLPPPSEPGSWRERWLVGPWTDPRVRRAGIFTAAFAGLGASLTYYAHTTNLDVPYLFWASWSLLAFTRAMTWRSPVLIRRGLLLATLAVGTKDQAYAMFLLALPIAAILWIATDAWAREQRRSLFREIGIGLAASAALFALFSGALLNPTGFVARVRFLRGSASQDFVEYTRDWGGRLGLLADAARYFDLQYPKALAPVIGVGIVLAVVRAWRVRRRGGPALAVTLLPLLVAVSFTVAFNFVSLRTNARFLMPQSLMLSLYGAFALEALAFAGRRFVRVAGGLVTAASLALALHACISVDVNLLFDPRYDAEAWLRAHVQPGDTIETYGLNVYLPRFPEHARVLRVAPGPVDRRNPLPGVTEVDAPYGDAPSRGARWVVLPTGWGWRYLIRPDIKLNPGRQLAPAQHRSASDAAATAWFERLTMSTDAFQFVHESKYEHERLFPVLDVHGTLGRTVWIYERKPGR